MGTALASAGIQFPVSQIISIQASLTNFFLDPPVLAAFKVSKQKIPTIENDAAEQSNPFLYQVGAVNPVEVAHGDGGEGDEGLEAEVGGGDEGARGVVGHDAGDAPDGEEEEDPEDGQPAGGADLCTHRKCITIHFFCGNNN